MNQNLSILMNIAEIILLILHQKGYITTDANNLYQMNNHLQNFIEKASTH